MDMDIDNRVTEPEECSQTQPQSAAADLTTKSHRILPKSKRWWKKEQPNRPMPSNTKPKSGWIKKMADKSMQKQVHALQDGIRQRLAEEKAQKLEARKEKEKRRKENDRKNEVVQVINPAKLKRMKKKQLKTIKRRDVVVTTKPA